MILVRAPLRISLVGGGSDLPGFFLDYGGETLSFAIDRHVYVGVHNNFRRDRFSVRYSKNETNVRLSEMEHSLFRSVLEYFNVCSGYEFFSVADFPAGTGMGSSSTFTVALVKCVSELIGFSLSPHTVASIACEIEVRILGAPIGYQDQYISALGGIQHLAYGAEGIKASEINLSPELKNKFENHFLLFYTGMTRSANKILSKQTANLNDKHVDSIQTLKRMVASVADAVAYLKAGDFESLGDVIHQGWILKKSLSSSTSNSEIDSMYSNARAAGCYGGKILGAGGGGFLFCLAPPSLQPGIIEAVGVAPVSKPGISMLGSTVITNDKHTLY